MSAETHVPHVSDLYRERMAARDEQERIERLGRRPAVPIPQTIDELHAYIVSGDALKLQTWMQGNYDLVPNPLRRRIYDYPEGQADALQLLVCLTDQCKYPSAYAVDPKGIESAVENFHGDPLWQWLYLRAYADHVIRAKELGNATRADLRAVLDQIKPLEPFALKQAQDALKPFH